MNTAMKTQYREEIEIVSHRVKSLRQFWSYCRRRFEKQGINQTYLEDWWNVSHLQERPDGSCQPSNRHDGELFVERDKHFRDDIHEGYYNKETGEHYNFIFEIDGLGNGYCYHVYEEGNIPS